MSDQRGWHEKFHVTRRDGESAPGGKHRDCEYFVLDLTHDEAAIRALAAYAVAVHKAKPALSVDIASRYEVEFLRAAQDASVMPMLGELLDAYEGLPGDLSSDPDFGALSEIIEGIGQAMEEAPADLDLEGAPE